MAYRTRRKTTLRRRPFKRTTRRTTASASGVRALAMVRQLKRQVSPEVKIHRENFGDAPLQAGHVRSLVPIPIGANDQSRIGSSVKLLRVSGRIHAQMNDSSSRPTNQFRLILFRGKQENDQPIFVNDVLANPGGLQQITSPKNWSNRFHTKIIYDKTYTLSRAGQATIALSWNFKLFGHLQFNSQDNTGNDIENGGLYMLLISDCSVPDAPLLEIQLQTSFTDA